MLPLSASAATALKAAAAGAAATWMMDRFDWFAFEHENKQARRRTQNARPGGMDPAHALAAKAAASFGRKLGPAPPHRHPAGLAIHYLVPILLAVLYRGLKRRTPAVSTAAGAAYGGMAFLLIDEVFSPLLGLAAVPGRYPWQRHARELAAHLIYGVSMHAMLQWLERPLDDGRPEDERRGGDAH